jgi:transcription elongation factor GreA
MSNYTYLTQSGYEKIKGELDELKGKGRDEAARAIAEAREKGDLSENAEYDAAKTAQGMLELRINELEKVLANARILDESQLDSSKVSILSTVKVLNMKVNKEAEYTLVSEAEADLKTGRISVSSPIGSGLMGKEIGDVAEVTTPAGVIQFKILNIRIN